MRWMTIWLVVIGLGGFAQAQQVVEEDVLVAAPLEAAVGVRQATAVGAPRTQIHVEYLAAEFGGKVVKGAPYSAQEVTETRQTLADGNRIVQRSTALVYRDSEGRVRRERNLSVTGPWTAGPGDGALNITIQDPVAGVTYILDPASKTARKVAARWESAAQRAHSEVMKVQRAEVVEKKIEIITSAPGEAKPAGTGMQVMVLNQRAAGEPVREALGTQVIEGVNAEGTRVTVTIPAGAIGNERPIQTVSETWYAPQLQTVVMSRQQDPRLGETVFRLANVSLAEPPASLFQIPPDYKVIEAGGIVIHKREGEQSAVQ